MHPNRPDRGALAAVALLGALALVACNGGREGPTLASRPAAQPTPAARGGYAFRRQDEAFASVLAESRRTNRPAVLFFWTSW
jgi:hypothetical protein